MHVLSTIDELRAVVRELRARGQTMGLVPTMGALHAGHISLVRRAQERCDVAIATIFVNPTQFAPTEDFARYPRTLEADLALLTAAAGDFLFVPAAEAIYPPGCSTSIDPPRVAECFEGQVRPAHFRGVCTVVLKLLQLAQCDVACFGQKDYQQALVIQHMVRDLNVPVMIDVCPIVREPDGLAMSSRNRYLSRDEREQALALSRALNTAQELYHGGERNARLLGEALAHTLRSSGIATVDYATVVAADTLEPLIHIDRPAVALIACRVGSTRLIDNVILDS